MSGRKCSEFRLQQEREEKLRLLQSLENRHAEVDGLKKRLTAILNGASEGLRTTFADNVQHAQLWLSQTPLSNIRGLGMDTDVTNLRTIQSALERVVVQGRQIRETLTMALTRKADEMGRRLAKRLDEVERDYISREQLLRLWYGEGQTQMWEHTLQHEAQRLLGEKRYGELERLLEDTKTEIREKARLAEGQEDKHQKRDYLLTALGQVCTEMGFEEVSGPRYERQGDRGSRISFIVDTLDRGRIAFTLSLDDISSSSELTDDRCFEDFGQLSQHLEETFGIHTQFRLADGEPTPELLRKGELDLPDDASMRAELK